MMSTNEALERAQTKYNAKNPRMSIRLGAMLPELDARTPEGGIRSESVRRDLGRYYRLMRAEVSTIGLNHSDLCAILAACRGMFLDEAAEVDAALICGKVVYYAAGVCFTDKLISKLRAMTPVQTYALADLICMYSVQDLPADEFLRGLVL